MIEGINNKLILEPYTGKREINAKKQKGWETVDQKTNLVGLKALVDGTISNQDRLVKINKGDVVFFPEELLYSQPWSKKELTAPFIDKPFIIAEGVYAVCVERRDYELGQEIESK